MENVFRFDDGRSLSWSFIASTQPNEGTEQNGLAYKVDIEDKETENQYKYICQLSLPHGKVYSAVPC